MRIDSITIDGFGVWHDWRIEPDPGLTVVRGDNEAGKTTLLAFVRAMLFGFETNRYPALGGGRRGGWLGVTMADERRYRIERYGERGGEGRLRVIGEDDVDRGASFLQRLLHGVESSVYRNVFAFRLDELSEFRGLTEGGVAARIYGAGLGTGAASALTVEASLRAEAASLFKSGGTNPRINRLLRQIEELDRELAAQDLPADYAQSRERLTDLEAERTRLSEELEERAAERRRLERIDAGWDHWLTWRTAADALAAEPDPGRLPAGALERYFRASEAARNADERLTAIEEQRRRVEEQLKALRPQADLLSQRQEIERLAEQRGTQRALLASMELARGDLVIARQRVAEALAELGDDWDEDRLAALDLSAATRAAVAGRFRDLLERAQREAERAESELIAAEGAAGDSAIEVRRLEERLAELQTTASAGAREAAPERAGPVWPSIALLLGAAGSALLAWELTGAASLVALLTVVGLAAAIWASRSRLSGKPASQPVPSEAEIIRAGQRAGVEEQLRLATQRVAEQERAIGRARQRAAAAVRERDRAVHEWSAWLAERGLEATLDRESTAAVLEAAASVRAAARRRDDAQRVVDRVAAEQVAFIESAQQLLAALDRPVPVDELPAAVDRLLNELRASLDEAATAARLEGERTHLLAAEAAVRQRRDREAAAVRELFDECGVATEGELRALEARIERHRRRRETAETARQALAALSGPGEAVDRLMADMAATDDIAELRDRLAAIRHEIDDLTARRDAVIEETGALQHQIAELETSPAASERRQQRADLVARLEDEAERWTVRSLAVALLERTRQRYEREHRPGVIRAAEGHLAEWTEGRYRQIVAPLGGTIEGLERADGRRVPIAGLSRGTAEQLYLALRFGLIEHFADEAEPLPIVMDEILVNFDEQRAERAARSIEQLAARHQILYFTCRPDLPLRGGTQIRLEPATLGAAVGADRPPALERS